jgi:hypothetical protein
VSHQASNRIDQLLNITVMALDAALEFREFRYNLPIGGQELAHAYKGANHENTHMDCAFGLEHCCGHDCSVLRERMRQMAASTMS